MSNFTVQMIMNRGDLTGLGIGDSRIRSLCRTGELVRLEQGIYAWKKDCAEWGRRDRKLAHHTAVLKKNSVFTLSHVSAALWHGAPLIREDPKIHVSVENTRNKERNDIVIYKNRPEVCGRAVRIKGYPVTDSVQTIVDCATLLAPDEALCIANYFLNTEKCSVPQAQKALLESRIYRRKTAYVAARLNFRCESPLETLTWNRFIEWGIELPEQQKVLMVNEYTQHRTDFSWEKQKLIVEADGEVKYSGIYGDPAEVIKAERKRQFLLEKMGWRVLRTNWQEVTRSPWSLRERLGRYGVGDR